jgi:hypothetical protein
MSDAAYCVKLGKDGTRNHLSTYDMLVWLRMWCNLQCLLASERVAALCWALLRCVGWAGGR